MICSYCNTTLTDKELDYNLSVCIYCGKPIPKNQLYSRTTMDEAAKAVISHSGKNILLDSRRFVALFVDYAPKLKLSKELLVKALNIGTLDNIISNNYRNNVDALKQLIKELKPHMSDIEIRVIICTIIGSLDWDYTLVNNLFSDTSQSFRNEFGQRSPPKKKVYTSSDDSDLDDAMKHVFEKKANDKLKRKHRSRMIGIILIVVVIGSVIIQCLNTMFPENTTNTDLSGDLNSDGIVSEEDLIILQDYLMDINSIPKDKIKIADYDGDGKITSHDAFVLKNDLKGE